MGKIRAAVLSLLFTLPVGIIFVGLLYVLLNYYDEVYTSMLGPALALLTLILGPYSLSLLFMNYGMLRNKGIQAAFQAHILKPFTQYIPAILGAGIIFWLWVTFSTGIIKSAIGETNIDKLIFLLSFLYLVTEAFKISRRTYELDKAIEVAGLPFEPAKFPFRLTVKQLRILVYAQSPIYLITVWLLMGLMLFFVHAVIESIFSTYLQSLTYLVFIGSAIWAMRMGEKTLEKYGREEQYIPWDSFY